MKARQTASLELPLTYPLTKCESRIKQEAMTLNDVNEHIEANKNTLNRILIECNIYFIPKTKPNSHPTRAYSPASFMQQILTFG
jgi:hypothetical protein